MAEWGIAAERVPLGGGHRNIVYRTVGPEPNWVFKSTRRAPEALAWLTPVQDCARQSGFIVPPLKRSAAGRLVEQGWTCEPFVAGAHPGPDEMSTIADQVARFHALARDILQRPGFLSSQDLLRDEIGGDVDLTAMPNDAVIKCREAWGQLQGWPQTIVHGDLNSSNLLVTSDGRIAVLDWDECRRDLAVFDIGQLAAISPAEQRAIIAWEVACAWSVEPDYARRMLEKLT
ncbi:phosphotransferase [Yoonia sp. SS1-5]|uniref:Phosphotransferase enzyme family protein n=1 Tax=Yoonia rhodophyticola TaxID=3137370 RepID=A0AAN0NIL7_9RHOB